MPTILVWFAQHRLIHLWLAASYFSLVVLPHEWFGKWIYATFFTGDIDLYNLHFLTATLLASVIFVAPLCFYLIKQKTGLLITLGYLFLTISLMTLAYFTIFVLATELVHFPQYAIMAILLFPLTWRYFDTLFWASLLGALDEAYQYFYLAPDRTDYYDFNDVIINFLGAALGLVFIRSFSEKLPSPKARNKPGKPIIITILALLFFGAVTTLSGWVAVYPSASIDESVTLLVKKIPESFWSDFHHIQYHIILPGEGLILLILLFILYSGLGKTPSMKLSRQKDK